MSPRFIAKWPSSPSIIGVPTLFHLACIPTPKEVSFNITGEYLLLPLDPLLGCPVSYDFGAMGLLYTGSGDLLLADVSGNRGPLLSVCPDDSLTRPPHELHFLL